MKYIFGLFTVVLLSIFAWIIYIYVNIRFDIDKIINYKPNLTTQFYDKNGKILGNFVKGKYIKE